MAPYEKTLTTASLAERRRWSERVLTNCGADFGEVEGHTVEIHAGAAYASFGLVEGLERAGAEVEQPLEGLGLGKRLAYYKGTGCL